MIYSKIKILPSFYFINSRYQYSYQLIKYCIFCEGNFEKIAELLIIYGIEVSDVGHAWLKIKAEKNYRPLYGGTTDEVDLLYKLVTDSKPCTVGN